MLPACFIIDDGWRFYIDGLSGLLKNFMLNFFIISPNSCFQGISWDSLNFEIIPSGPKKKEWEERNYNLNHFKFNK